MSAQLFVCLFTASSDLAPSLQEILEGDHYQLRVFHSSDQFLAYLWDQTEQIDCLILHQDKTLEPLMTRLRHEGQLLPAVILKTSADNDYRLVYHQAQIEISVDCLVDLPSAIEDAITDFLNLTPEKKPQFNAQQINEFLTIKQHRLTEKLQERLGYKGVYYKRNPQDFFRNLSSDEKKQFLQEFTEEYRLILLEYFNKTTNVNARIDQFVNRAFFADLSVSQIMEIHMELMDQFSQQLKLEGRSDEILLDYRLTLIDIVAHLCEMYRRSIPTKTLKK